MLCQNAIFDMSLQEITNGVTNLRFSRLNIIDLAVSYLGIRGVNVLEGIGETEEYGCCWSPIEGGWKYQQVSICIGKCHQSVGGCCQWNFSTCALQRLKAHLLAKGNSTAIASCKMFHRTLWVETARLPSLLPLVPQAPAFPKHTQLCSLLKGQNWFTTWSQSTKTQLEGISTLHWSTKLASVMELQAEVKRLKQELLTARSTSDLFPLNPCDSTGLSSTSQWHQGKFELFGRYSNQQPPNQRGAYHEQPWLKQ